MPYERVSAKIKTKAIAMKTVLSMIFFMIEAIFLIIISLLYDFNTQVNTAQTLFIKKGSATRIIADLGAKNLKFTPLDAKILSLLGVVKQGYIDIGATKFTKIDFLKALTTARPALDTFTIIQGETTIITLQNIAKKQGFKFDEFERDYNASAPYYEGFLVPETYSVAKGLNRFELVKNLVAISQKAQDELKRELNLDVNASVWNEILVKASIIQKEAANVKEMPLVAGVIENRLAKNMKLEMDGTLNYGQFSHIRVTPARIKNDTSSFNTYLNFGLPNLPVCLPSREAIKAAINPAKHEFLYFMLDRRTGEHNFARTYDEHLKNIEIQRSLK